MQHSHEHSARMVLQTDFLQISYIESERMLRSEWNGWLNSAKGKEGCQLILDVVKERGIIRILNDNSKVTGASGDTGWLGDVWLPALGKEGVQFFAWVYSQEFFTQMQIDIAVDNSKGLAVKTFFSVEEARNWLYLQASNS